MYSFILVQKSATLGYVAGISFQQKLKFLHCPTNYYVGGVTLEREGGRSAQGTQILDRRVVVSGEIRRKQRLGIEVYLIVKTK
jgi:hypothetical protein